MSLSNASESDLLKLLFQNIAWANVGDVTGLPGSGAAGDFWISLHTADPGEAGDQTTSEATYTGYGRVSVARDNTKWTVSGTAPTQVANASAVTFGLCTLGTNTITHFAVGRDSAGAGEIIVSGTITSPVGGLIVNPGITPSFAAGQLVTTAD